MSSKRETLLSPRGVALYPHLSEPDFKFKEEGEFSTKLRVSNEDPDAQALVKRIEAEHKKAQDTAKEDPRNAKRKKIKESEFRPYEIDEDAGEIIFNFKMNHRIKRRKDGKEIELWPALFDAAGKPLPRGIRIGSGSILRVAFTFNHYYTPLVGAGVGMRLEAVQVIKLVEQAERSASSYGFDTEEDGFRFDEDSFDSPLDDGGDEDLADDEDYGDDEDADF